MTTTQEYRDEVAQELEQAFEAFLEAWANAKTVLKDVDYGEWERVDRYVPGDGLTWVGGHELPDWVREVGDHLLDKNACGLCGLTREDDTHDFNADNFDHEYEVARH